MEKLSLVRQEQKKFAACNNLLTRPRYDDTLWEEAWLTARRLNDPCYYFNRHESWMDFNRRVLEERVRVCANYDFELLPARILPAIRPARGTK
jgi:hypothetical protein